MIPREEELVYRTGWLVRVRWLVVLLMGVAALASWLLELPYPERPLLLVAGLVAVYNVLFAVAARWAVARPVDLRQVYRFVNVQIGADFLALLAWVHYTGGPTSPFLPFFVFHLVICGLLVSRRMTLVHAGWVLAALVLMGLAEARGWLPHRSPLEEGITRAIASPSYLVAVGLVIVITFLTIAVVVGGIAKRLRRRELELDEAQHELERHSREIETAHARLEKLDRERSAFFRMVSHQIRSPLASIQTVLRLVTSGYAEDQEKTAELVGRAERQSQQMLALINDMLSLTRIKELDETQDRETVALGPLIADVVEAAQNGAQSKGITLEAEIDAELPSLSAVRNQVLQLFAVLVDNAVKYTPQGGRVEVKADYDNGEVRVEVKDSGIGFPPDERDRIFGEFYRAPNARLHDRVGTGLGLSIAEKVVHDLGGRIEVESTLGRGSTFTVIIPVPGAAQTSGGSADRS
jgi:signal transduction histidine kinase